MRAKVATTLAFVAFASAAEAQPPAAPAAPGPEGPPAVPPGYEPAPPPAPTPTPSLPPPEQSSRWPDEEAADDGRHRHDGFFLRFSAGGGFGRDVFREAGTTIRRGGGQVSFSLAMGGAFTDHLVAYTELFLYQVPRARSDGFDDESLSMSGLGLGVAYYVMPANAYVGGSIAVVGLAIGHGSVVLEQSRPGVGVNLQAGKEWWIASEWALGLALQTFLGWARAEARGRHALLGLGAALSLTYN